MPALMKMSVTPMSDMLLMFFQSFIQTIHNFTFLLYV